MSGSVGCCGFCFRLLDRETSSDLVWRSTSAHAGTMRRVCHLGDDGGCRP